MAIKKTYKKVPVNKLVEDPSLMIRQGLNQDAVLRYRELFRETKKCPALKIQAGTMKVIDGYHRLDAAKAEGIKELGCDILEVLDSELRALAYRFNAKHGVPLSIEERNRVIVYLKTKDGKTHAQIAKIVGLKRPRITQILAMLAPNTTNIELSREKQIAIVRLILKGDKQEDIAATFDATQGYVSQVKTKYFDSTLRAYRDEHLLKKEVSDRVDLETNEIDLILQDFGDPLNFEQMTGTWWPEFGLDDRFGKKHPSNIPAGLVRNILALFTKPGDMILDPAAGGGVVIDVAEDMVNRKCYAYDLTPVRPDIKPHNLRSGPPPINPEIPDLIFLDPPYGPMKEYSADSDDLANLDIDEFLCDLSKIFSYWDSGILVVLMASYRKAGKVTDLPYEAEKRMIENGWTIIEHIVNESGRVPSETGANVQSAKDHRWLMRKHIHILVGRKE